MINEGELVNIVKTRLSEAMAEGMRLGSIQEKLKAEEKKVLIYASLNITQNNMVIDLKQLIEKEIKAAKPPVEVPGDKKEKVKKK